MKNLHTVFTIASLVVFAACSGNSTPAGTPTDAATEDTDDTGFDTVPGPPDTTPDGLDTAPDLTLDTPDSAPDLPTDTAIDTAPDGDDTSGPSPGGTGEDCRDANDCESGLCVAVAADRSVCSNECETGCVPGWTCVGAICQCGATDEVCDALDNDCDAIVDEGEAEPLGCPSGGICTAGSCGCPSAELVCDDSCVDPMTSGEHCGECDQACSPGDACVDGYCPCLSDDDTRCDSLCTDLDLDVDNCGGCGISCGFGICDDGSCVCVEHETKCAGGCFDTTSDLDNCGSCGSVCGEDETCVDGVCGCGCPDGSCEDGNCLPLGADERHTIELVFTGDAVRTDIVFNVDNTGSMGESIRALASDFDEDVVSASRAAFDDPAFALTRFADFPCVLNGSGGSGRDVPMRLEQRVTTLPNQVLTALENLRAAGGRDIPETGIEALNQIATGVGTDDCRPGVVPPFDPTSNRVEGVADGAGGGVGFRGGAQPIVFHLTDAPSHAREDEQYKFGATEPEAVAALQAAGIRVVGLFTIDDALEDLQALIAETGTTVPPCAWDGARPIGCDLGQCCTSLGRTGTAPNAAGECPLGYYVRRGFLNDGDVTEIATDAYRMLAQYLGRDVTISAVSDEDTSTGGFDTDCLVEEVRVVETATPGVCGPESTPADLDADGVIEAATGVTGATTVRVEADLNTACASEAGAYPIRFELRGTDGVLLGVQSVFVLVR